MQDTHNSFTAITAGGGLALANEITGFANHPLLIVHVQEDLIKALLVGFVGAIGGLIGKAIFLRLSKLFKKLENHFTNAINTN